MRFLTKNDVPFTVVVEPQDAAAYAERWKGVPLFVLPNNDKGLCYARNAIKEHSQVLGVGRHWEMDDDVSGFSVFEDGRVSNVHPSRVLRAIEDACASFGNVALAGPSNTSFKPDEGKDAVGYNKLIAASCMLVDDACPTRWEIDRMDEFDYCLSALCEGWTTMKFTFQLFGKANDVQISGNYSAPERYAAARAKLLEKWPEIFVVKRNGRLFSRVWQEFKQRPHAGLPLESERLDNIFKLK